MADIKYEITEELGVLSGKIQRLDQGTEPDFLERQRGEIRHPRLGAGTRKNGKRRHPYRRGSKTALQAAGRIFRIGGNL